MQVPHERWGPQAKPKKHRHQSRTSFDHGLAELKVPLLVALRVIAGSQSISHKLPVDPIQLDPSVHSDRLPRLLPLLHPRGKPVNSYSFPLKLTQSKMVRDTVWLDVHILHLKTRGVSSVATLARRAARKLRHCQLWATGLVPMRL